jgi:hypothetical protein
MLKDRRAFLSRFAVALPSMRLLWAAQHPPKPNQNPRTDPRPREDDTTPAGPPAKSALKENEKDIKKDIQKLYDLVSELKGEVEKTDSSQVLSLGLVRKAEEIEKLAREIKNRAKG